MVHQNYNPVRVFWGYVWHGLPYFEHSVVIPIFIVFEAVNVNSISRLYL